MSVTSRAVLAAVVFASLTARASAEERALPRIAVAQIGEFHVARTLGELGPDVVIRAAAQGVRDACFGPDGKLRGPTSCERPAANAPEGVCVDTTLYKALAPLAACAESDRAPEAIELRSPCRTTECISSDAKAAGATHVLLVQGKSTEFGLDVAIDLIALATGPQRSKRYGDYFPASSRSDAEIVPRTGPQIVAIVHGMARDAVGELLLAPPPPPAAAPPPPAGVVTAPAAPVTPPSDQRPLKRAIGVTAAGLGLVAIVAGSLLWYLDGTVKGDCKPNPSTYDGCPVSWDTLKYGVPLVIGGAVAAGVGGWLIYRSSRGEVAATASAGGVGLRGSF
jgi:hypothetical protein